MKRVKLKLFVDDVEVEEVSIRAEHFLSGKHAGEQLVKALLQRLLSALGFKSFDAAI